MYCVKWWDANGDCKVSGPMSKEEAVAFRDSMHSEQEADIFYVKA